MENQPFTSQALSRSGSDGKTASPSGNSTPQKNTHNAPKIRRRNRLITSCLECRRRKLKCDKQHPCTNCMKFSRDCVFLAPAMDSAAQLRLAEIKEKMGSLEKTLEEDVVRRRSSTQNSNTGSGSGMTDVKEEDEDEQSGPEDERYLAPNPLTTADAWYAGDADNDLMDLGIAMGKMRITERIGGFVRPKLAEELDEAIQGVPKRPDRIHPVVPPQSYLRPGPDYVAPASSFFFAPEPKRSSIMEFLPSKNAADQLLQQYWACVHPIARVVHRPTFHSQYESFWNDIYSGNQPPASFQALTMAAMLSAVISLSEEAILADYGVAKAELIDSFRRGTEMALYQANFLRTTKLETLQAFVCYLIPQCRNEISRGHSALTATAIRLAECMGLHRDGSHYDLPAVELHVRRLVWHQLCFLDIRTCEASGPRPSIRKEDFDTKFPLHMNDSDLDSVVPATEDKATWTEMTIPLIRMECNEMHRLIWIERFRLDRKKTVGSGITSLLAKVQDFRAYMEKKYIPMFNRTVPLHNYAFQVLQILTLRMHIMVLFRYISSPKGRMPERLRQIILSSGTQFTEHAITIETSPFLRPWAWYGGALQQYHTAMLLLSELYASPVRPMEARVWKCLDYVFDLPPEWDYAEKSRYLLTELRDRTQVYRALRKLKAPTSMERRLQTHPARRSATDADEVDPPAGTLTEKRGEVTWIEEGRGYWGVPSNAQSQRHTSQTSAVSPGTQTSPQPQPFPLHTSSSSIPTRASASPGTQAASLINHALGYSADQPFQSIANGEALFAPSPIQHVSPSGTSVSDGSGGMLGAQQMGQGGSPQDMMLDIDWNEWDRLFPPGTIDMNMTASDFNMIPDVQFGNPFGGQ